MVLFTQYIFAHIPLSQVKDFGKVNSIFVKIYAKLFIFHILYRFQQSIIKKLNLNFCGFNKKAIPFYH